MDRTRVALVTGAGQGLGRAIALALSNIGIEIAAVGRTKSKLDRTLAELPGKGIAVTADLTDPQQVRAAFESVAEKLGGVDILVNCAADYSPFRLDEASDAQITNMIAQSLTAPVFCMREAIGWMRKRGGGDIVNITSQSAEQPQPFMGLYSAAKAGIETISQNLRWELKGENFRILVCQIGVIADTVAQLDGALGERIAKSWAKTGIGPMYAFPGSKAETIAGAVAHAVNAPRDTHFYTLRLRGMEMLEDVPDFLP